MHNHPFRIWTGIFYDTSTF